MQITCSKCRHKQQFQYEVQEFKGYVCPNCHAYFRGTNPDSWVFVKNFTLPENPLWPVLNEKINLHNRDYVIITKIQRDNEGTYSNEYVGLANSEEDIYLSEGPEYACELELIDPKRIDRESADSLRLDTQTYEFEESSKAKVTYAEGFVFEDLDKRSKSTTYSKSYDDTKFVSKEIIDDETEYYFGTYWNKTAFARLFSKYDEFQNNQRKVQEKFLLIVLPLFLLPAILFYFLNQEHFVKQTIKFNETFTSSEIQNSFISTPFELKGTKAKQLKYEGFTVPNVGKLTLQISLVNELTNQVTVLRPFIHATNPKNQANALTIDFCRVKPGKYHLVYETSGDQALTSPLKLEEQVTLVYGGASYVPLIMTYIVGIILLVILLLDSGKVSTIEKLTVDGTVSGMAVAKHKGLVVYLLALSLLLYGLQYWIENINPCNQTVDLDAQVDHTQTGTTRIYRRSALFNGNHK